MDKRDYLLAMERSPIKEKIRGLLKDALTSEQSRGLYEGHQPQSLLRRVYDA